MKKQGRCILGESEIVGKFGLFFGVKNWNRKPVQFKQNKSWS